MQIYKTPLADMKFVLEAFGYEQVSALEPFAAYDFETTMMLLGQAAAFGEEEMMPLNRKGDEQGVGWDPKTGAITTAEGFKEVYAKLVENGFVGICGDEEFGGGGAPITLGMLMSEVWTTTNKSLSMCPGLTVGLVEALHAHGSDELKQAYLPKLVTGQWSGTMCLTEPQAGTDLGLVRTKAVPFGDHYKLTGNKIWITFGDHDMTENVVHLVLARLPDAPPGIKGISTFVVPKITLEGKENGVRCNGIDHKMGIKASPTCVIDMEDSEGWIVGEPHRGMRSMFTMMNGARLAVGAEGIALSEISYQTALAFARDRRQSRSLDPAKQDKSASADNILVHPDVRRMLLNVKSTTEGMRGLATLVGINIDLAHNHPDDKTRERADDLVALLTPIVKSFCSERGFMNISEAMQVCGGAGYTTDWGIEQYMRDIRIAMIYEGTNHIQALDLVGRKLPMHGGRPMKRFAGRIAKLLEETKSDETLSELLAPLGKTLEQVTGVTMQLAGKAMADAEEAGASASSFLNLFGLLAVGYSWGVQAKHAVENPSPQSTTKINTARYYFTRILPEASSLMQIILAGKDTIMAFDADEL